MPPINRMLRNSKNLHLSAILVKMIPVSERVERKKPAVRTLKSNQLTDQQVLEIRALREFGGLKSKQIAPIYGITVGGVNNLISYNTRVLLTPKREHLPADYLQWKS